MTDSFEPNGFLFYYQIVYSELVVEDDELYSKFKKAFKTQMIQVPPG
jgi:hypothetical protein